MPTSAAASPNGFSTCPLFGAAASQWDATDQFQVVGSGAYYLKADSVFRGKGTTVGLPSTLLPSLKTRSTQPPRWNADDFTSDSQFGPNC